MVRFLHTSDWHVGKSFESRGEPAGELEAARLEGVETLAEVAADHDVDFGVVAGDIFDSSSVSARTREKFVRALNEFDSPIYLLPGNHDPLDVEDSVWETLEREHTLPEHVHVVDDEAPVSVAGGEAVLLPGPVRRRHTFHDALSHVDAETGPEDVVRIGLAHAGTAQFETDARGEATNWVDPERVERADLDYLALGDWHGTGNQHDRVWYSGTPEPTSYKDNDQGHALVVEIEEHGGAKPSVERRGTAQYEWFRRELSLYSEQDVEAFVKWADEIEPMNALIDLDVEGVLPPDTRERARAVLDELEEYALSFEQRGRLLSRPDLESAQELGLDGVLGQVAEALVDANQEEEDSTLVDEALDEAEPWYTSEEEAFDVERITSMAFSRLADIATQKREE